jgi:hypothetical protein
LAVARIIQSKEHIAPSRLCWNPSAGDDETPNQAIVVTAIASAGRRVDPVRARRPRFPLVRVPEVSRAIREALLVHKVDLVVSSAACGADIVVLEAAVALRMHAHVILPFAVEVFRKRSVTDRPGDWGTRFDTLMTGCHGLVDVEVLSTLPPRNRQEESVGYERTTEAIIAEATSEGANSALVVWDGQRKPGRDETADFRDRVAERRWSIVEVLTTERAGDQRE